jgi:hypothetical protein
VNRATPSVPLARRGLAIGVLLALVATLVTVAPPVPPADASTPAGTAGVLADYDGEVPDGHLVLAGDPSSVTTELVTVGEEDPDVRPAQVGDNGVLRVPVFFASGGGNTFSDDTCNPGDDDAIDP